VSLWLGAASSEDEVRVTWESNPGLGGREAGSSLLGDPVREGRRLAAVILLLQNLREWRDPHRRGDGDSYKDGHLLLLPHEPHCRWLRFGEGCDCVQAALAELERLLACLKADEPRLHFHVRAWFVDTSERGRWEWRKRRGRRPAGFVYRRWVDRDPRADRGLALLAAGKLADSWGLRDARGELVEPWLVAPGVDKHILDRHSLPHSGLVRPETGVGG